MGKILFINPGSEGHINPTIEVCKSLVDQGEEVVYYLSDIYESKLANTGVEIRSLPIDSVVESFTAYGNNNVLDVINGVLNTAHVMLPRILNDIKHEHFDYVIYDSMFGCGYLIAQKLNIPAISSVTTFAKTKPLFDNFITSIENQLDDSEVARSNQIFQSLKTDIETTYQVQIPSRHEIMNNPGDLNISYIMQGFQHDVEQFNAQEFVFAGTSVRTPQPTEFMNNINTSRPVIYISLGTVFNENISFFNRCFAALKDLDVTVVVSIGTTNNLANFDDIPSNFIVESYVPQIELLQHTDLFITHAGMNSTNEAMMMDVPLLAFPQSADQPVVSHQIEQLGIGKKLDSATVTTTELKTTVTEMLTNLDYYKANIAKIKQLQSTTKPGYQVAVEAILNFKKQYVH